MLSVCEEASSAWMLKMPFLPLMASEALTSPGHFSGGSNEPFCKGCEVHSSKPNTFSLWEQLTIQLNKEG